MELETRELYLNLMKQSLTNWIYGPHEMKLFRHPRRVPRNFLRWLSHRLLEPHGAKIMKTGTFVADQCKEGRVWSPIAHTMIGFKRLDNIQRCLEDVLRQGVSGDVIEAGVWRGGATIFMRALLKAYGVKDRIVWVADSFEGLPPP